MNIPKTTHGRISEKNNKSFEGLSLEEELRQMMETGENPDNIKRIHEPIYTERKDGVLAEYNIRTDRWEKAQDAMEIANKAKMEQGNARSAKDRGQDYAKSKGQGSEKTDQKQDAASAATAVDKNQ